MPRQKHQAITVLMPTRNGARFLAAQLASLAAQTRLPRALILSDDGSQDQTCQIATAFARDAPFPVRILCGPERGLTANALRLLQAAPAGPLAWSDQDDVWLPDRLARGAEALAGLPAHRPVIAAAARIVTDVKLVPRGVVRPTRSADFATVLVQNPAAGNTILMNAAAADLARAAASDTTRLAPFPDWWLCQIVLGAGGTVILDPQPSVLYRQHGTNALGAARGLSAQLSRARRLFDGTFGDWLRQNIRVLFASRHRFAARNRLILEQLDADFANRRFRPGLQGMTRADLTGDVAFRLAARLGCLYA